MEKQQPKHEVRLGRIKATIWENDTSVGMRYNTTFSRIYRLKEEERNQGDNGWRETSSFGRDDLPLLTKVADMAHTWAYTQSKVE